MKTRPKIYSIGTDPQNDIVLPDNKNIASHFHATLKIYFNGKITLTDHSCNGTFINGRQIEKGQEVQVGRKDYVSFAHVFVLNWNQIPNSRTRSWLFLGIAASTIFLAFIFSFSITYLSKREVPAENNITAVPQIDSLETPPDTSQNTEKKQ